MRWIVSLIRTEKQAPRFFGAYAQSALGTGAGYVAIVLIAYQRFHSPLAISLVLLADIVPPMLLGTVFGAAVDRWSRRWSAIVADITRALAFVGIALVHNFPVTFLLALLAGVGTALWKPAIMAGLPSVVSRERLPAATALYGALTEIGYSVGPALAGLVLVFAGPAVVLAANAGSFALSALLLSTLSFGARRLVTTRDVQDSSSLLREARSGIRLAARTPMVRVVLVSTSSILFFVGLVNVAELLLSNHLGAGKTGYAALVTISGIAIATGSLIGKSGGVLRLLERRFLLGLALFALGLSAASASPVFGGVLAGVALGGIGNGMVIVFQRLILQASVDERFLGRIFGVQVALDGAAFTISYLVAGGLLTFLGPRALFVIAGAGAAVVAAGAAWVLRRIWVEARARAEEEEPESEEPPEPEPLAALGAPKLR
jgi:MFS family permease